jgi:hypothetical protein
MARSTTATFPAAYDEALERVGHHHPEYGGGLANHGPMALEAMAHMGRPGDELDAWARAYERRLEPGAEATGAAPQLGVPSTYGDWVLAYTDQLRARPWADVVRAAVARLTPGVISSAAHGLLRTAHAVRALDDDVTAPRLHELACGLAYWSASYEQLPGVPSPSGSLAVAGALAAMPHHSDPGVFLISDAVQGLRDEPAFVPAVDAVDPSALDIGAITSAVAGLVTTRQVLPIVYVHAITAPSCLRSLTPLLEPGETQRALRYAWQAVGALVAAFPPGAEVTDPGEPVGPEELVALALDDGDEHALKVTAACLDEWRATGDQTMLAAAARLVGSGRL